MPALASRWEPARGAAPGTGLVDRRRWMSALPDPLRLSGITIPGTHDSAARDAPRMARCQRTTLPEQLDAGIRFLDIRCKIAGGTLRLYHGAVALGLSFEDDVRDVCLDFLRLNPGETVVLLISNEAGTNVGQFEALVRGVVERDRGRWHLGDRTPELGRVRGRIVLIRRFATNPSAGPFGLDGTGWADDRSFRIGRPAVLDVQDRYIVPSVADIPRKWAAIRALLDGARGGESGIWTINYCSGTSGRRPGPASPAAGAPDAAEPYPDQVAGGADGLPGENRRLLAYVRTMRRRRALGTIVLDYADEPAGAGLVDRLIRLNFGSG